MYIKRQLPFSKHAILSYIIIPFLFTRIFFTRVELGKPLPFTSRLRIELSRGEKRLTWDSAFICADEGLKEGRLEVSPCAAFAFILTGDLVSLSLVVYPTGLTRP